MTALMAGKRHLYQDNGVYFVFFNRQYCIVKEEGRAIVLENEDTDVKPIPIGTGGGKP